MVRRRKLGKKVAGPVVTSESMWLMRPFAIRYLAAFVCSLPFELEEVVKINLDEERARTMLQSIAGIIDLFLNASSQEKERVFRICEEPSPFDTSQLVPGSDDDRRFGSQFGSLALKELDLPEHVVWLSPLHFTILMGSILMLDGQRLGVIRGVLNRITGCPVHTRVISQYYQHLSQFQ